MSRFLKITNLDKVKDVAITLLHCPVITNDRFSFIVSHPFASSSTVPVQDSNSLEFVDIVNDSKGKELWISQMVEKIQNSNSLISLLMLINKPYYFAFIKFAHKFLSEKDLANLLSYCWTSVEYSNDDANLTTGEMISLMKSVNPQYLMTEEDYEVFKKFNKTVTVYRGVTMYNEDKIHNAISWTLDTNTARFFADRFKTGGKIYKAEVRSSEIVAYFNTRDEKEVIVWPTKFDLLE